MNAKNLSEKTAVVDHPYFDKPSEPLLRTGARPATQPPARLEWRQALGVALIVGGVITLVIGYVGISGTKNTYDQLTYFLSNGIGGLAAIIVGSTLLVIREHIADRRAIRQLDERVNLMDSHNAGDAARRSERADVSGVHAKTASHNGAVPNGAPRHS